MIDIQILFLPGIGASHRQFPEYQAVFDNFHIVRYKGLQTLKEHLEKIDTFIRTWEREEQPYVIIGHSLGANLGYHYVSTRNLRYFRGLSMIGGGPRFSPLDGWNTIFSLPRWGIALVLIFIVMGAPFLFLVYGWRGMYQRVNVVDLFKREGVNNIKAIYMQTLTPLLSDPVPYRASQPVQLITLPNDMLLPEAAIMEAHEMIPNLEMVVVPREIIHFSHHLDVLVAGYVRKWLVRHSVLQDVDMPYETRYAMAYPQSVVVDLDDHGMPRKPVLIILIGIFLWVKLPSIEKQAPSLMWWNNQKEALTTQTRFLLLALLFLTILILQLYYYILNPAFPTLGPTEPNYPKVSIVVPMRNESRNISTCLSSLLALDYPNFEVILSDGSSEDNSVAVAQKTIEDHNPMKVPVSIIQEGSLPDGWIGKSWGCWQGSQQASGELILFTDADTNHQTRSLRNAVQAMKDKKLDGMSIVGRFETLSFWEKAVLPFFKSLLFLIFAGRFNHLTSKTLAIGQYILVNRQVYYEFGGHQVVKSEIAEDIHLASKISKYGYYACYNSNETYSVRMYRNLDEIRQGLRRNAYESVGGRKILVLLAITGLFTWRILPLLVIPWITELVHNQVLSLTLLVYFLFTILLFVVDTRINQNPWYYALIFPLGVILVIEILAEASLSGNNTREWKGRFYN